MKPLWAKWPGKKVFFNFFKSDIGLKFVQRIALSFPNAFICVRNLVLPSPSSHQRRLLADRSISIQSQLLVVQDYSAFGREQQVGHLLRKTNRELNEESSGLIKQMIIDSVRSNWKKTFLRKANQTEIPLFWLLSSGWKILVFFNSVGAIYCLKTNQGLLLERLLVEIQQSFTIQLPSISFEKILSQ